MNIYKNTVLILLAILAFGTATMSQNNIVYPYNPDIDTDGYISTLDLLELLGIYSSPFTVGEIFVDGTSLGEVMINFQNLIENSTTPGSQTGEFLRWNNSSETWEPEYTLNNLQINDMTVNQDAIFLQAISVTGNVSATDGAFSGSVSGATGSFSGSVSGATGSFSGAVSGSSGTFSGAVSGATGSFSGDVNINGHVVSANDNLNIIATPTTTQYNLPTSYPLVISGGEQGLLISLNSTDVNEPESFDSHFIDFSVQDQNGTAKSWGSIRGNSGGSAVADLFGYFSDLLSSTPNSSMNVVPSCPWKIKFSQPLTGGYGACTGYEQIPVETCSDFVPGLEDGQICTAWEQVPVQTCTELGPPAFENGACLEYEGSNVTTCTQYEEILVDGLTCSDWTFLPPDPSIPACFDCYAAQAQCVADCEANCATPGWCWCDLGCTLECDVCNSVCNSYYQVGSGTYNDNCINWETNYVTTDVCATYEQVAQGLDACNQICQNEFSVNYDEGAYMACGLECAFGTHSSQEQYRTCVAYTTTYEDGPVCATYEQVAVGLDACNQICQNELAANYDEGAYMACGLECAFGYHSSQVQYGTCNGYTTTYQNGACNSWEMDNSQYSQVMKVQITRAQDTFFPSDIVSSDGTTPVIHTVNCYDNTAISYATHPDWVSSSNGCITDDCCKYMLIPPDISAHSSAPTHDFTVSAGRDLKTTIIVDIPITDPPITDSEYYNYNPAYVTLSGADQSVIRSGLANDVYPQSANYEMLFFTAYSVTQSDNMGCPSEPLEEMSMSTDNANVPSSALSSYSELPNPGTLIMNATDELILISHVVLGAMDFITSWLPPAIIFDPEDIWNTLLELVFSSIDLSLYIARGYHEVGVEFASGNADYAEWLPKFNPKEMISNGDVVGVIEGHISKSFIDADHYMVVSKAPLLVGNTPTNTDDQDYMLTHKKVAFLGQVPVKVRGEVNPGDYILTSGYGDGLAMAVNPENMLTKDFERIVGIAWEGSSEESRSDHFSFINTAIGLNKNDLSKSVQSIENALNDVMAYLSMTDPNFKPNYLGEGLSSTVQQIADNVGQQTVNPNNPWGSLFNLDNAVGLDDSYKEFIELVSNFQSEPTRENRKAIAEHIVTMIEEDYGIDVKEEMPLVYGIMENPEFALQVREVLQRDLGLIYKACPSIKSSHEGRGSAESNMKSDSKK